MLEQKKRNEAEDHELSNLVQKLVVVPAEEEIEHREEPSGGGLKTGGAVTSRNGDCGYVPYGRRSPGRYTVGSRVRPRKAL